MAEKQLSGLKVAAITSDGVEQVELLEPKKALEEAGAQVLVVAPKAGKVQGFKHHDKADQIPVDLTLDQADPADFDAVLLPGGVINADALRMEKKAQEIVRQIDRRGNPIAVICHGPWLLISAGLTRGHIMTSWPTLQDDIRNSGAGWEDREVIRDRNWVSSRKPDDIPAFNREVIKLFSEAVQKQRKVA
ncbi:MAG TPA: type 1 glutamine amidotransferase domain-containing protein [Candidatus Angelobacter sp.]|nr:type 1 glutamine amidotransferase domain-containing protein [Candidatus Angelobacter sp.]